MTTFEVLSPFRELDRVFENMLGPNTQLWRREGAELTPPVAVNVFEDADNYYVQAVLPGAVPDQVEITAVENGLTISGELQSGTPDNATALWREWFPAQFRRSIQIPKWFDVNQAEAHYAHGLLYLRLPKAERSRAKTIKISTNGSSKLIEANQS